MRIDTILAADAPLEAPPPWEGPAVECVAGAVCHRAAVAMLRSRALRRRRLQGFHLADPVWDILLDLYVAAGEGKQVSISDLAIAAAVPRSTGVRWVATLVLDGKLVRRPDPVDGRRHWVTLSADTKATLDVYFLELTRLSAETGRTAQALRD